MLKHFFLILFPLLLLTGATVFYIYNSEIEMKKYVIETEELHSVEVQKEFIISNMAVVASDIMIFSRNHELKKMLTLKKSQSQSDFIKDLLTFSTHKRIYDQVRFLDSEGMEVVRINYNKGNPQVVAKKDLQLKKGRYYFRETMDLKKGEIYMSPFDLNIEKGVLEKPIKPMIRFGTPVYDSSGRKRGIFILNYFGAYIIRYLKMSTAHTAGKAMLLNSKGYYIIGSKAEDEWGFMYDDKKDRTFINDFPHAWKRIAGADSGQFYNKAGLYTFFKINPLMETSSLLSGKENAPNYMTNAPLTSSGPWLLVSFVSNETFSAAASKLLKKLLFIYSIIVAILVITSWFMASAIRKKVLADEAIRELDMEKQFRMVVDKSPIPMVITDAEGNIERFNDKFIEIFGWTTDDVRTSEQWWKAVYPDEVYREEVQKSWEAALKQAAIDGKEIETQTWGFTCKNGDLRDVEFNMTHVNEERHVIILNDISVRKHEVEELEKYREHLEEMVKERTKGLEEKNSELKRFYNTTIDREFRIKELRDENDELKKQIGRNDKPGKE